MSIDNSLSVAWLRRDLRLHDHAALFEALAVCEKVQPVFVLDTDVLAAFPNPQDRRLSFIAATLAHMDAQIRQKGGRLLVLHGSAKALIPKLVASLGASALVAAEDYEPQALVRDKAVAQSLCGTCDVRFVKDQLVFSPREVTKPEGAPYKVFTPYSKAWRALSTPASFAPYVMKDQGRYADSAAKAVQAGFVVLDASDPPAMLKAAGYEYCADPLWPVDNAQKRLATFIAKAATRYGEMRDMVGVDGTSRLSPYLRFGLVSARECAGAAIGVGADKWLSELIWREFYAMILFHFPDSVAQEWNPKYRGTLNWSHNEGHLQAWQEGMTGYPMVDAAMRQLKQDGWMHNRARMVVASFLTKHLRIDWRLGEAHFAQLLMDYDMASNVGGWQWAASTGTDAQPYFRVFNPVLQSLKFDPDGAYIHKYVPELHELRGEVLHAPWQQHYKLNYPAPLVDHATARDQALAMFKAIA